MINSPVDEIKNRLDIVEVIQGYIKLQKAGANYRALCPFHSEKKSSFFVSPVRQIWHCFGCGAGGGIFEFVMKIEGIEFGDALRILAQKAGIELKKQDPKLKTARQRLYEICEISTQFFQKQLESKTGLAAKKYLNDRGINEESIKKWRLGYAPDIWRGLSDFLVGKGYKREEIVNAGLAIEPEKGQTPYDRFRGRIIFPVFDLNSQVIGFGGRIFEMGDKKQETGGLEPAKYINTPQTALYDKSRVLYGLNNAKVAIRKQGHCVLVEGYTDAIMSHQAGFDNTIAVSGTALTSFHLDILKRYSENLILAFDMDIAGDTATKRGIDLALERGFGIKITKLPPESDPADIILKNPKEWEEILKETRSIIEFYFDSALAAFNKDTPEGKKEIGKMVLPAIKRIPNKIEQSHWIQLLAKKLKTREEDVFEELKKARIVNTPFDGNIKASSDLIKETPQNSFLKTEQGRKKILEEKVISLVLKDPSSINLVDGEKILFFSTEAQKILENFKKFAFLDKPEGDFNKILANLENKPDEELKNFLATLSLRAEVEYEEDAEEEIEICLAELKYLEIKNKLKEISEELKKAEEAKNHQKINVLIEEFNKLAKELL
ncbi:MAG: DNA primase [Candidatus Staskawiczbacteria bacterium CG10_big_fil_rev_8_21_14_0_10_38_10]|uniref:DNA primase n=1 Tax=Candidatus Staskawiczbacteria bacterium CG10_big_fil_rev_8_21_14_0_10_38_10 TaxID=1974891 RepID=A0A2H9T1X2_9BACT|nr:MAG: DNA primase [Candidatus Staskawiczbacteria bacterium CG10_big_fil_rev_8_21_14_0_10_38_10]